MSDRQGSLLGHFMPLEGEKNARPFTRIIPSQAEMLSLKQKGQRYIYTAYWASNLDEFQLARGYKYIKNQSPFQLEFSIAKLPKGEISSPKIFHGFDGAHTLTIWSASSVIGGNCLRILLGTSCKECAEGPIWTVGRSIATSTRVVLGLSAAFQLFVEGVYDVEADQSVSKAAGPYIFSEMVGTGADQSALIGVLRGASRPLCLRPDIEVLFNAALQSSDSSNRVLFLWFAIEAAIGDGKARSIYCKKRTWQPGNRARDASLEGY